jgi:hypothetical protein
MIRLLTLLSALALPPGLADQVKLLEGGSITGEVDSMDSDGRLVMTSPITRHPLELRAERVLSVHFGDDRGVSGDHDALVTLANGDTLPGELVSVGPRNARIETDFAGPLEIPRSVIRGIKIGIRPRDILYSGPGGADEWPVMEDWILKGGSLVATGRGHAARRIENLPESFSLAFDLQWLKRPNFKVYFCSATDQTRGSGHNRYYLQFAGAGFEIKRESDGRTPFSTIGVVDRKPSEFPDNRVRIEIRVDRAEKTLLLFFDGKLQGRYYDEIENLPGGDHLIFENINDDRENLRVGNLEIREWSMFTERHRSEDRGDQQGDSLIDHEGQRFGGELLGTRQSGDGKIFLFKSPHYPESLEIPVNRVSTVFFDPRETEPADAPWQVEIRGGGRLRLSHCDFSPERVAVDHPLLGKLTVAPAALVAIEHRDPAESADTPNPDPE